MLLSLFWIARICQFHCLYSPIFNHLDSSPLTHLPLTQHFKPLMLGHIDNINRFRRCAIWHAPDNSEFSIYSVNSGLKNCILKGKTPGIVIFMKQNKYFNYEPSLLNHVDLQYRLFRLATPQL